MRRSTEEICSFTQKSMLSPRKIPVVPGFISRTVWPGRTTRFNDFACSGGSQ